MTTEKETSGTLRPGELNKNRVSGTVTFQRPGFLCLWEKWGQTKISKKPCDNIWKSKLIESLREIL